MVVLSEDSQTVLNQRTDAFEKSHLLRDFINLPKLRMQQFLDQHSLPRSGTKAQLRDRVADALDAGTISLDCLVVASHEEGMPTVTLEAWAMGVPVVSTPVGLIRELEPRYGPLVESAPRNPVPDEIADGIRRAVKASRETGDGGRENPSPLAARPSPMRTTARELAINELSMARMVREFERLAVELTNERRERGME